MYRLSEVVDSNIFSTDYGLLLLSEAKLLTVKAGVFMGSSYSSLWPLMSNQNLDMYAVFQNRQMALEEKKKKKIEGEWGPFSKHQAYF